MNSFCLIVLNQALEKALIRLVFLFHLQFDPQVVNTIITILVAFFTVYLCYPLCCNTFLILGQGLSKEHSELIIELKKSLFGDKWKVIDSHYWLLDMSYIIGSIKIQTELGKEEEQMQRSLIFQDVKSIMASYVTELTVEFVPTK
jgi:Co/Zn/Cd efflux system component